jgi:hypothetical protein
MKGTEKRATKIIKDTDLWTPLRGNPRNLGRGSALNVTEVDARQVGQSVARVEREQSVNRCLPAVFRLEDVFVVHLDRLIDQ